MVTGNKLLDRMSMANLQNVYYNQPYASDNVCPASRPRELLHSLVVVSFCLFHVGGSLRASV